MYEDPENKTSTTNIMPWVVLFIGATVVVPVSTFQLTLLSLQQQASIIEEQTAVIEEQRDLIYDLKYELKEELNDLEKELIKQSK